MAEQQPEEDSQNRDHKDEDHPGRAQPSLTIVVNGREKTVTERELNTDDLVKLAFENPATGKNVVFTITYRRGPGENPEGTLEEGQTVMLNQGMVFNVTPTDKS